MTDHDNGETQSLVPLADSEIASRPASLVRRGLNLLAAAKPTEETEITRVREEFLNRYDKALVAQEPNEDTRITRLRELLSAPPGVPAWSLLALQYQLGVGVPQDDAQAAQWYRKAANQGDATAQGNLGQFCLHGIGVPQNDVQAAQWFSMAAEQGDAFGQFCLGEMYAGGRGVQQDDVEAYKWISLAAARTSRADQDRFAEEQDAVAKKMSPGQLAEGQQRARVWIEAFDRKK